MNRVKAVNPSAMTEKAEHLALERVPGTVKNKHDKVELPLIPYKKKTENIRSEGRHAGKNSLVCRSNQQQRSTKNADYEKSQNNC